MSKKNSHNTTYYSNTTMTMSIHTCGWPGKIITYLDYNTLMFVSLCFSKRQLIFLENFLNDDTDGITPFNPEILKCIEGVKVTYNTS